MHPLTTQSLSPGEIELVEVLRAGAIAHVTDTGEILLLSVDDLPETVRECIRASRIRDRQHQLQCPACLASEAENMLADADSYRDRGNTKAAWALEIQAGQLLSKAESLRGR
jgi:hypothetical protein